jgi:hypothetical protein
VIVLGSILVHVPKPIDKKVKSTLAPKLSDLSNANIAFLDNLKPQSDHVLNGISELAQERVASIKMFKKIDTPTLLPDDVIGEIKENFHGMITGVGD